MRPDPALETAPPGRGWRPSCGAGSLDVRADELTEGQLVRPFGSAYATTTDFAYHLVYPKARAGDAKIAAFRDCLLAEAQRHAERFAALPG